GSAATPAAACTIPWARRTPGTPILPRASRSGRHIENEEAVTRLQIDHPGGAFPLAQRPFQLRKERLDRRQTRRFVPGIEDVAIVDMFRPVILGSKLQAGR